MGTEDELKEELLKGWSHVALKDMLGEDSCDKKLDPCRTKLAYLQYMKTFKCLDDDLLDDLVLEESSKYGDLANQTPTLSDRVSTCLSNQSTAWKNWTPTMTIEKLQTKLPTLKNYLTADNVRGREAEIAGAKTEKSVKPENRLMSSNVQQGGSVNRTALFHSNYSNHLPKPADTFTKEALPCGSRAPAPAVQQPRMDTSKESNFWTLGNNVPAGKENHVIAGKTASFGRQNDQSSRGNFSNRTYDTPSTMSEFSSKRPRPDENDDEAEPALSLPGFRTAREQLALDNMKPGRARASNQQIASTAYGTNKRSLGTRRGLNSKFIPPIASKDDNDRSSGSMQMRRGGPGDTDAQDDVTDERLKHIDPKMVELVLSEILDQGAPVEWDDIAGLEFAKKTIKEIVVFPMLRPDLFTGLRGPPKGLLLFGPPGTGKTLIGKCIANQSKSTFFSISASSLTSKWVGEGEKMVRALFAVARVHQPAVVFIDEIDSLLSQRSDSEHESSRRIKTEFLVQLDGATTGEDDRILVVGATNRPQEIDEAARRRFVKRLYIPLPEAAARHEIIARLMLPQNHVLARPDIVAVIEKTHGYSGADMANLCKEAAMGPIRTLSIEEIQSVRLEDVRPITMQDFEEALQQVKPSVSQDDLAGYITWNNSFGSWSLQ